ncbi:MAG: CPBP family intramembrane glutamic endopeptidase [Bacteroidota bacterium]
MVNTFISAFGQVIVFSLIPFIVYLISKKKAKGFFSYIGLKRSNAKANGLALLLMIAIATPILLIASADPDFRSALLDPSSVSGRIRAMGFGLESSIALLLIAVIKTGLSEEIFFRGFVAKRLIAVTSFRTGNMIQAIIFGAIHTLLFLNLTDNLLFLVSSFVMPAIGAYIKVYLNEKMAGGSIVPGWIAHASSNLIAYSIIAFVLRP